MQTFFLNVQKAYGKISCGCSGAWKTSHCMHCSGSVFPLRQKNLLCTSHTKLIHIKKQHCFCNIRNRKTISCLSITTELKTEETLRCLTSTYLRSGTKVVLVLLPNFINNIQKNSWSELILQYFWYCTKKQYMFSSHSKELFLALRGSFNVSCFILFLFSIIHTCNVRQY